MSPRRIAAGRARAVRALLSLAAAAACLGAVVAYATGRAGVDPAGLSPNRALGPSQPGGKAAEGSERPPRPTFIEVPEAVSVADAPQFRFHVAPRAVAGRPGPAGTQPEKSRPHRRFQCRLDGAEWSACVSPLRLAGPAPGGHELGVRAWRHDGQPGPAAAYAWQQAEPKRFSIESEAGPIEELFPGFPAEPLPVVLSNPNAVAIEVTSLTATIAADPPGCAAEPNFILTPSSASPAAPVTIPAGGSARLPAAGASAPAIALRNLASNQDACMGARVEIAFSGEARG